MRAPHFGQGPSGVFPEKSTGAALRSSWPLWPKSSWAVKSSRSFSIAANGRPMRLRKPCSGPIAPSRISCSTSSFSMRRPAITFQIAKSQLAHWNFL